jgi:hypothetical protein
LNLYGFVGNNPISVWDYLGWDFIAVGRTTVEFDVGFPNVGVNQHANLLYFESDCEIPEDEEFEEDSFITDWAFANVSLEDSVELIAHFDDWEVEKRSRHEHDRVNVGDGWHTEAYTVSVIEFGNNEWETMMVSYQPSISNSYPGQSPSQQRQDVQDKWDDEIIEAAESYGYAEQTGYNLTSENSNFPDSKYFFPPGNNSNTFIRWLVDESDISMPNLSGTFPGASTPQDVPDEDYRNPTEL